MDRPHSYFVIDFSDRTQRMLCWMGATAVNMVMCLFAITSMPAPKPETVMPIRLFTVEVAAPAEMAALAPAAAPAKPVAQPKAAPQKKVVKKEIAPAAKTQAVATVPATEVAAPSDNVPVQTETTQTAFAQATGAASASATPAQASAGPVLVTEPRYRHRASPIYPADAVDSGIQGLVVVEARINGLGRPVSVRVIQSSGSASLDQAAIAAAQASELEPYVQNGMPMDSTVRLPFNFALN